MGWNDFVIDFDVVLYENFNNRLGLDILILLAVFGE